MLHASPERIALDLRVLAADVGVRLAGTPAEQAMRQIVEKLHRIDREIISQYAQTFENTSWAPALASTLNMTLEAVRVRYLGKKGSLNAILRGLGATPPAERPAIGALANEVKDALVVQLDARGHALAAARLARDLTEDRIDVTLPGRSRPRGHVHPLRAIEEEIVDVFRSYQFKTEILVASVRSPMHIVSAARMGADVCTCPAAVIEQCFKHPLTDIGLEKFLKDWEKAQAARV